MASASEPGVIRLRGVRHNNLKGFDLDLPLHRLIVVTGLSGSGKSSLAFDTLYAEGQRRYIETFSPYARQFFDRMDKPRVDTIEGIPPAIAIEQRNTIRTTRSTVGTMTEICDYLKVLWPHLAQLHCRGCGKPVRKEPPQEVWKRMTADAGCPMPDAGQESAIHTPQSAIGEALITFGLPLSEKLSLADSLTLIAKQGYQRLLVGSEIVRLEDAPSRITHHASRPSHLTVIQDRLRLVPSARARFIEACEQAYHFGKGKLTVFEVAPPASGVRPSASAPSNPQPALRNPRFFSNRLHCATCDIEYATPSPALFSFNHPLGACPDCKGFGRVIGIDYHLALPDRSLTLAEGAVRPWRSGFSAECQGDLRKFCRAQGVRMDVPFRELPEEHQRWILEGEKDYGIDEEHQWPRAWYGVKGYFRWLETKAYKMHVRVLLSRYRSYTTCPKCNGARLKPDALLYLLKVEDRGSKLDSPTGVPTPSFILHPASALSLADFYALSIDRARAVIEQVSPPASSTRHPASGIGFALEEVRSRLRYLQEVGLGYLTLDRPTRTLSGGETERVNLTTCLGTRLVNTLYVLDEPSVGLHPRDTARLIGILEKLRDTGNTVVVVEHEASVMRAADQIVDLGPGHGESGGEVVFQGPLKKLLAAPRSLTGAYLSGRKQIEIPKRRPVGNPKFEIRSPEQIRSPKAKSSQSAAVELRNSDFGLLSDFGFRTSDSPHLLVRNATRNNLKNFTVAIPLGRFVCLTGVSGSGKTTLVREVLYPALNEVLGAREPELAKASDRMDADTDESDANHVSRLTHHVSGAEHLRRVLLVDQSSLGKTPRSNPAVYVGAFDDIREVFAQTDAARQRGFNASAFSFNSAQGQCERCRGAGFEKIEMQFLSDIFIRCPDCNGRRYRGHILEVTLECGDLSPLSKSHSHGEAARAVPPISKSGDKSPHSKARRSCSIADLLDATVDEAIAFLASLTGFTNSKPAARATAALTLLQEVGLGYLRLGQPINTLSGGECQRLKLAAHLAEFVVPASAGSPPPPAKAGTPNATLFIFDEPTTGLHFEDVRILLQVFQRLVDVGHSVLVIEHNLDVIKCADWVIDLGPEAGEGGGQVVAVGTPEHIAACEASHTGRFLSEVLPGLSKA
jgi:excinuclease ABC subunit A